MTSATLTIDGFYRLQIGQDELPAGNAVPVFRWRAEGVDRTWPQVIEAELPTAERIQLVPWLDVNGTGRLDTGDRCGRATSAAGTDSPGPGLTLRIDQDYIGAALSPPAMASGRISTIEFAPTFEAARAQQTAGLILLGFQAQAVTESGFPSRETAPVFEWRRPAGPVTWPARVQAGLPVDPDLRLYAIIDVNGDGRLGPGDHLSVPTGPFVAPEDPEQVIVFRVDRTLPSAPPPPRAPSPDAKGGGGCGSGPTASESTAPPG